MQSSLLINRQSCSKTDATRSSGTNGQGGYSPGILDCPSITQGQAPARYSVGRTHLRQSSPALWAQICPKNFCHSGCTTVDHEEKRVSWAIYYIDDFLTIGAPASEESMHNTLTMQSVCDTVGLPMELTKSVGPTTQLIFLLILMDLTKGELCLPQEKLLQLQDTLGQWRGCKAYRKRELLSLISSLSHTCKVVRAGRTFLHRLIDLSTKADHLYHFICLNAEARADIEWWYEFIGP